MESTARQHAERSRQNTGRHDPCRDRGRGGPVLRLQSRQLRHRDAPVTATGRGAREDGTWRNWRPVPWGDASRESWRSLGRPETLPPDTPKAKLAEKTSTVDELRPVLEKMIGADSAFFAAADGTVVWLSVETLLHVNPDRSPFLPFIPEVLATPYEVWMDFEEHATTGRVELKKTLRQAAPHRRQGDGADHGRPGEQRSACGLDLHPYGARQVPGQSPAGQTALEKGGMKTLPYGGFVTRHRFTGPYPDLRHCFFRIQDSQQGVKQRSRTFINNLYR